jgi:hypothetical protein
MCIFVIEFHNVIEFNPTKLLKELNWIWLNPIKFNLIEISMRRILCLVQLTSIYEFHSMYLNSIPIQLSCVESNCIMQIQVFHYTI